MKKLLLSPAIFARFQDLKKFFSNSVFVDEGLEIRLECQKIIIGVLQPDQYPESVNCFVVIRNGNGGASFLFGDVWYALKGRCFSNPYKDALDNDVRPEFSVLSANDQYVSQFIDFCIEQRMALEEWPPSWFFAASNHSVKALEKHFPEIAARTVLENQKLWTQLVTDGDSNGVK